MLEQALAGPLEGAEEVIFANRLSYDDGHWYANIGYYCDNEKPAYAGNGQPDVGRLCKLNLKTGNVAVLLDAQGGSVRDPVVHYDAGKILFAYRKTGSPNYHLYEIATDGSNLRQLTSGPFDDYEPAYLPDGGIVFVSTRAKRWVSCWHTQVGILFRCDGDGGNIRCISSNIEHDNTPAVLPDGRLIYTRWEYVDRSQVGYHHLWTMNPDGTGQMAYYGNQQHYPLFIAAKPIPGTDRVLGVDAPGHGQRDHYGYATVFTDKYGPDDPRGARRIHAKGPKLTDPYPITEHLFLAAQNKTILLLDTQGRKQVVHTSDRNCYEPALVRKRARERVILPRTDPGEPVGRLMLTDVYEGRNLSGIKRGDIKKLLVLEPLPKPVNFSGGPDLVSWLGTFSLERVLGTVPVEEDGSAFFEVPANRPVFFVALDGNDRSVKRMQSFVNVMPGEVTSCVGCHEHRYQAPPSLEAPTLQAMQRPPSVIRRFEGYPDVLDFNRDIQPILDRHCVTCHNYDQHEGRLSLKGDLGHNWSIPFYALFARAQVADGRNGYGNQPPRTIGSSASELMNKIDGSHHDVKLPEKDWRTIWLWIESAAPYAGSYAGLRNKAEQQQSYAWQGIVFHEQQGAMHRRCTSCHNGQKVQKIPYSMPSHKDKRGITRPLARHERRVIKNDPLARFGSGVIFNFSRPEKSPVLLAPLAKAAGGWGYCGDVFAGTADPDYLLILNALRKAKAHMESTPRYGTPAFTPNPQYIREMKRFGILPTAFDRAKDPINFFETDQAYWCSLHDYP